MNRRRTIVIGIIALASVSVAVFSYYYFMSARVYVEVSPGRHDVKIVDLTEDDLASYPTLQRLMLKADESRGIVPSRAIEQISRIQANEIANLLEMSHEGSDADGAFAYNDTIYRVHLFYQYNAPGTL